MDLKESTGPLGEEDLIKNRESVYKQTGSLFSLFYDIIYTYPCIRGKLILLR